MAYVISGDCISCGNCKETCPVGAISEGDGKYEIDPASCIECGACAADCPVEAIKPRISDSNVHKEKPSPQSEGFSFRRGGYACR